MPKLTERDKMLLGMEQASELEDRLGRLPTKAEIKKFISEKSEIKKVISDMADKADKADKANKTDKPMPVKHEKAEKADKTDKPNKTSKTTTKKSTKYYWVGSDGVLHPLKSQTKTAALAEFQGAITEAMKNGSNFKGDQLKLLETVASYAVQQSITFKKV
jgi:hypothetical protein